MKYHTAVDRVELHPEAMDEGIRPFTDEDLEHIRDACLAIQDQTGATALPGLEAVYYQIQIRIEKGEQLDD